MGEMHDMYSETYGGVCSDFNPCDGDDEVADHLYQHGCEVWIREDDRFFRDRRVPPDAMCGECRPCEEFEERNRYQRNRRILLKDLTGDCVLCTLPLIGTGEPIHIHHIVPRMQGGGDELSNLAPVHALCNLSASIGSDPSPTLDYRRAWVDRWRRGEEPTMIPPVPAEGWRMWGLRQILPTLPETELEELANALPKGARRDGVLN